MVDCCEVAVRQAPEFVGTLVIPHNPEAEVETKSSSVEMLHPSSRMVAKSRLPWCNEASPLFPQKQSSQTLLLLHRAASFLLT